MLSQGEMGRGACLPVALVLLSEGQLHQAVKGEASWGEALIVSLNHSDSCGRGTLWSYGEYFR